MPQNSTSTTTTMPRPLDAGLARPGAKPATATVRRTTTAAKSAKRPRPATPAKRRGTPGGQLTIAILAGLAIGLVTLAIYSFAKPSGPWAFDRPEAKLPSLQQKHTLY